MCKIDSPSPDILSQDTDTEFPRIGVSSERFSVLKKLPSNSPASIRRQHDQVADQRIGAGRIVQVGERLAREDRDKADDRAVLLRDEHPAIRLDAAGMDSLTVRIGHRFAWTQARIQRTLEVLELDDALTYGGRVGWTILPDQKRHGHEFVTAPP